MLVCRHLACGTDLVTLCSRDVNISRHALRSECQVDRGRRDQIVARYGKFDLRGNPKPGVNDKLPQRRYALVKASERVDEICGAAEVQLFRQDRRCAICCDNLAVPVGW